MEFTQSQQPTTASAHGRQTAAPVLDTDRAEDHFGMSVPDVNTLHRLKSMEQTYGGRVHDWIDEGMPTDIMGKTRDMEAFRQRQADRPAEVPTDIERRNNRSVQRSQQAAADTGKAGETGVPDPVRDVISSSGRSLDASIQRAMEDRMDESFSDVQIHPTPRLLRPVNRSMRGRSPSGVISRSIPASMIRNRRKASTSWPMSWRT